MLSVVVINKNRLNYLALKIQSLLYQSNLADLDILVVDYSDTDDAASYCNKRNIRCIRVKGDFSISRARNVGIRHARCQWICISGNDTLIDRYYFARLCGLIRKCRGRRFFFSGFFTNFVKRKNSGFNEKFMESVYVISDIFSSLRFPAATASFIEPIRSLIVSTALGDTDIQNCREQIGDILRSVVKSFSPAFLLNPVTSLVLLHHLLTSSLANDNCLETFHDHIFSHLFLQNKVRYPYSFQTFTRPMAEALHGYDEAFTGWGGEDDDFKKRAEFLGYRHVNSQLLCIHLEHRKNRYRNLIQSRNNVQIMNGRQILKQPGWGLCCPSEELC